MYRLTLIPAVMLAAASPVWAAQDSSQEDAPQTSESGMSAEQTEQIDMMAVEAILRPIPQPPLILTVAQPPAPPPSKQSAARLPDATHEMLQAAIDSADDAKITAVAALARKTHPEGASEIDRMIGAYNKAKQKAAAEALAKATFWDFVSGKGEIGAYRNTGSSDQLGLTGGLHLTYHRDEWQHELTATADYLKADGVTSSERFVFAYEPRYDFDPKHFIYGLGQYEHDLAQGYKSRYSFSSGVGVRAIDNSKMTLNLDIGPAYRRTDYYSGDLQESIAGRGSLDFKWKLSPTLTFSQTGSAYVEQNTHSVSALSAFDAKIFKKLSARISYNVQYDKQYGMDADQTSTFSRVSLVYDL